MSHDQLNDLLNEFTISGSPVNLKLLKLGQELNAQYYIVKDEQNTTLAKLSLRSCPHVKNSAYVGLFDCQPNEIGIEASKKLLRHAEDILRSRGINQLIGPVDISTWFNYRFSVPTHRFYPRFKWEPTTSDLHKKIFDDIGFKDFAYYQSTFFPYIKLGPIRLGERGLIKSLKHLTELGYAMKSFSDFDFETQVLPNIHEITHEAFDGSFLFEPLDFKYFCEIYTFALRQYDYSPSGFLIDPNGEIAGYLFAFYDGDYMVVKSIALKSEHQNKKLSSGMIYWAIKQSFLLNKRATISALVKKGLASDNIGKRIQKRLWFTWTHDYLLMHKKLDD